MIGAALPEGVPTLLDGGLVMSIGLKSGIDFGAFGRRWRLPRWLAAVVAVFGFFLLTSAVEIGGASNAEAQSACSCPAGYTVGYAGGGAPYCYQKVGGGTMNCNGGGSTSGHPRVSLVPPGFNPYFGRPLTPDDEVYFLMTADYEIALPAAHLGMYVSPTGENSLSGYGGGFAFAGKYGVSDTAGAVSGTADYHGSGGGGGIYGSYAITPQLLAGGSFDYQRITESSTNGFGSVGTDNYSFTGYLKYYWLHSYASASATYDFVPISLYNAGTGGTGSTNGNTFSGDFRIGHIFTLVDPGIVASRAVVAKAPPQVSRYGLLLDVSGHVGYFSGLADGFTDSTGFVLGNYTESYGDVGAKAKLEWLIPGAGGVWMPYVAATIDQEFAYHNTWFVPAQGGAAADTLIYTEALTYYGGQLGLSVLTRSGWEVGAYGFDTASTTYNIIGGTGYVKLHF